MSITSTTRALSRSITFTSSKLKRKLPDIPIKSLALNNGKISQEDRSSVGVDHGFYSLSDERSSELDSGCASMDMFGEETSVDPPVLLPKRNASNFLWVELCDESIIRRRPKHHDRLSQTNKSRHRHSAPPGTLDKFKIKPVQKRSLPGNPSFMLEEISSKPGFREESQAGNPKLGRGLCG